MTAPYLVSALTVLSAGLAFLRPTIWSCFAACAMNAAAVWYWWPVLMAGL